VPMLPTADQSLKPRHYSDNDMGHAWRVAPRAWPDPQGCGIGSVL